MRQARCLAAVWMLVTGPLRADWKITISYSDENRCESVHTQYYKGDLRRSDSLSNRQAGPIVVQNLAAGTFTMWDTKRKVFMTVSPLRGPAAAPAPVAEVDATMGPVELIETDTTETGERQTILGRTARHFITSEKQSLEETPGAEAKLESETVRDEWYRCTRFSAGEDWAVPR